MPNQHEPTQPNTTNITQLNMTQLNSTLQMWAIFYATLVGMERHPGNKHPRTLDDLAEEADRMIDAYMARKHLIWDKIRGTQPAHPSHHLTEK